jgi:hypothetical protein
MASERERLDYRRLVFPGEPMTDKELDGHINRERITRLIVGAAVAVLLAFALYQFLK